MENVSKTQFFKEMTLRICSSLDFEKALQQCFEFLESVMPLNFLNLVIWDPDFKYPGVVASVEDGQIDRSPPEEYFHFSIPEELRLYLKNEWYKTGYIRMINSWDQDEYSRAMRQMVKSQHDLSIISLPLHLDNEAIGIFSVSAIGENRYTDFHASLISVLNEPFSIALSNALRFKELNELKEKIEEDYRYLRQEMDGDSRNTMVGAKTGLRNVMQMINQVAPMNCPVLLLGETGTGKELVANAIHYSSPRKEGPFIKVNCGAIAESLVDSELFGHEKGAFTGAISKNIGRFERAHHGTIFLDEIGELPAKAQVRLVRAVQQNEIERVGGINTIQIDTRIISATNRNLEKMVDSGNFREDLWFRLNVFPIVIPPLRMRSQDIPELVDHMIRRKVAQMNMNQIPELASDTIKKLSSYYWPGNVRELENIVERALIRHTDGPLKIAPFFSDKMPGRRQNVPFREYDSGEPVPTLNQGTTALIKRALTISKGKIYGPGGAAEILDMHPNTLRYKISKLNIK